MRPRSRPGPRLAGAFVAALGLFAALESASAFVWPNVPEQVAAALDATDPAERRLAVRQLPRLPRAIAETLVQKALADSDVEVRLAAASVAAGLPLPRGGELVIAWLNESDARLRLAACEAVRAAPTDRAVAALGRVLGDADASVRVAAAAAMGASASVEATSPLLGHLDDPSPEVRAEVARALGLLGDPRAVLPLVGKVQDGVPEVRRAALRALGALADARATVALTMALADSSQTVRIEALGALAQIRSDEATFAIASLVEGLADAAASTLPGAASGVGAAVATGSADPGASDVRRAALRALGQIGSPRAIEVLLGELAKEDPSAERPIAREALVAVGPRAVVPLTFLLGTTVNAQAASGAALALGELRAAAGRVAVARAMERGLLPLRHGLTALGGMGDSAALPTVLERVGDADPLVRREAIRAATSLLDPDEARRAPGGARAARAGFGADTERRAARAGAAARPDGRGVGPRAVASAAVGEEQRAASGGDRSAGHPGPARARGRRGAAPGARRRRARGARGGRARARPLWPRLPRRSAARATGTLRGARPRRPRARAFGDPRARGRRGGGPRRERAGPDLRARARCAARGARPHALGPRGARLAARARGSIDDRRKVAEALAGHATQELATLRTLAADTDAGVRANAAWSLGEAPSAEVTALLTTLLGDADGAVASNAAAALGRAAARGGDGPAVASALARALADGRPYVRANALAALARAGLSNESPARASARERVLADPAAAVRAAAATFLHGLAAKTPADVRALARCASEDHDGGVATRCALPRSLDASTDDVVILVAPDGADEPLPRARFALERADGLLRSGTADRRGAVFERATPSGTLRLVAPVASTR